MSHEAEPDVPIVAVRDALEQLLCRRAAVSTSINLRV
jgi:hypothetical protein